MKNLRYHSRHPIHRMLSIKKRKVFRPPWQHPFYRMIPTNKKQWAIFFLIGLPISTTITSFYMRLITSLSYAADDLLFDLTDWSPLEWLGLL